MKKQGALAALIILVLGIVYGLPGVEDIGITILQSMNNSMCTGENVNNIGCQQIPTYIWLLAIFGILGLFATILYAVKQAKRGNW